MIFYFIHTERYGLENFIFNDYHRAQAKAQELLKLAPYRGHKMKILQIDGSVLADIAGTAAEFD